MADEKKEPTAAQKALLEWMVSQEEGAGTLVRMRTVREWSGGSLIDYYHERWIEEHTGVRTPAWLRQGFAAGSPKVHAWRRAGGYALAQLAKAGYVKQAGWIHGVPQYFITDEGYEVGGSTEA